MSTQGNDKTEELYKLMIEKGYPPEFASVIAGQMHTEYTSERMIRYISRSQLLPIEEVADEMLSIIAERDRLVQKHITEYAQGKINEMYRNELPDE